MRGQKAFILRLLKERGARGVSVHELVYEHGITRAAAAIHELRKETGISIETLDEGDGKLARYILTSMIPKPEPPLCSCKHPERHHVSGFRCMADTPEGYCVCEKYDAVA